MFVLKTTKTLKRLILTGLLSFVIIAGYSQEMDTMAQVSESSGQSSAEKLTINFNKSDFFTTYDIPKSMKGIRSKLLEVGDIRSAPSCESEKLNVAIPKGEIVMVYKYFNAERCWAVHYKDAWGFIPDNIVFPVFDDSKIKKATKYDEPPQLKTQIRPKYPPEAKKKGIKGKVYVKVYINEKGVANDAIILQGIPELNQAAIDAVKKAKYKPARLKGKPVGVWVNLSLNFN
jgi:TonB family protein